MGSRSEQATPHGSQLASVQLRPVSADNVLAVCALDVRPDQRSFVSPNAESLAQAYVEPHAVPFAIYRGDDLVGFLMLFDDGVLPRIGLWRLMIGHEFQGRGYGAAAVRAVVDRARRRDTVTEVVVGALPGEKGPSAFYQSFGFAPTGEVREDGEVRYRLMLTRPDA